MGRYGRFQGLYVLKKILIAQTCGAYRRKAETPENLSVHSKGDLKTEPKIFENGLLQF